MAKKPTFEEWMQDPEIFEYVKNINRGKKLDEEIGAYSSDPTQTESLISSVNKKAGNPQKAVDEIVEGMQANPPSTFIPNARPDTPGPNPAQSLLENPAIAQRMESRVPTFGPDTSPPLKAFIENQRLPTNKSVLSSAAVFSGEDPAVALQKQKAAEAAEAERIAKAAEAAEAAKDAEAAEALASLEKQSSSVPRSSPIKEAIEKSQLTADKSAKLSASTFLKEQNKAAQAAEEKMGNLDWWAQQPETSATVRQSLTNLPPELQATKNLNDPEWQKKALEWITKNRQSKIDVAVQSAEESARLTDPKNLLKNLTEGVNPNKLLGRNLSTRDTASSAAVLSTPESIAKEASVLDEINKQEQAKKAAEEQTKRTAQESAKRAAEQKAAEEARASRVSAFDEGDGPSAQQTSTKAGTAGAEEAAAGASKINEEAAQMGADQSTGGTGAGAKTAEQASEHASGTGAKAAGAAEEAAQAGKSGEKVAENISKLRAFLSKSPALKQAIDTLDDTALIKFVKTSPVVKKVMGTAGGVAGLLGVFDIPDQIKDIEESSAEAERADMPITYRFGQGLKSFGTSAQLAGTGIDVASLALAPATEGVSALGVIPGIATSLGGLGVAKLGEYIAEKARPEVFTPRDYKAPAVPSPLMPDKLREVVQQPEPEVVEEPKKEQIDASNLVQDQQVIDDDDKLEQQLISEKQELEGDGLEDVGTGGLKTPDAENVEKQVQKNRFKNFNTKLKLEKAKPIIDLYTKYTKDLNLDLNKMLGHSYLESGLKAGIPNIDGISSATGLGQITKKAYKELQRLYPEKFGKISFQDMNKSPDLQVQAHLNYFKSMLDRSKGDYDLALRKYYSGFKNNKTLNEYADKGLDWDGKTPLKDKKLKNGKTWTVEEQKNYMRKGGFDGPNADNYVAKIYGFENEFRRLAGLPINEKIASGDKVLYAALPNRPQLAGDALIPSVANQQDLDKSIESPEIQPSVSSENELITDALSGNARSVNYAELMDLVRKRRFNADMGAALANFIAGTSAMAFKAPVKNVAEDFYKQMRENAVEPISDIQLEEKLGDMDPKSASSKFSQKLLGRFLAEAGFYQGVGKDGKPIPFDLSNLSKNDLEKRFKDIESIIKTSKNKKLVTDYAKFKDTRKSIAPLGEKITNNIYKATPRNADATRKVTVDNFYQALGFNRPLSIKEAQNIMYVKDKDGKQILNPKLVQALDSLPDNIAKEGVIDVARLFQGGVPPVSVINSLKGDNIATIKSKIINFLTGDNLPAHKGALLAGLMASSSRIGSAAVDRMYEQAQGMLSSHAHDLLYSIDGEPVAAPLLNSMTEQNEGIRFVHPVNWPKVQAFKRAAEKHVTSPETKNSAEKTLLDTFRTPSGRVDWGKIEDYLTDPNSKLPDQFRLKPINYIDIDPFETKKALTE
jgi:hypothetical protein